MQRRNSPILNQRKIDQISIAFQSTINNRLNDQKRAQAINNKQPQVNTQINLPVVSNEKNNPSTPNLSLINRSSKSNNTQFINSPAPTIPNIITPPTALNEITASQLPKTFTPVISNDNSKTPNIAPVSTPINSNITTDNLNNNIKNTSKTILSLNEIITARAQKTNIITLDSQNQPIIKVTLTQPNIIKENNIEKLNAIAHPTNLDQNLQTSIGHSLQIIPPIVPGVLQFSLSSITVNENIGHTTLIVNRLSGADTTISTDYNLIAGTAQPNINYTAVSGTLTWGNKDNIDKTFDITILMDYIHTNTLTFSAVLINPQNCSYGPITTENISILNLDYPVITSQPSSLTVYQGSSASFTVAASGILPLYYQWYKNNTLIPGASSTLYNISSAGESDKGNYCVTVTNLVATVTSNIATLTEISNFIISGLSNPFGLALDSAGALYIADAGSNSIKKWDSINGLTTLVSGLNSPTGVAVDSANNVYIANNQGNNILKYSPITGLSALIIGLYTPQGIAIDSTGSNLYIAEVQNNTILKYSINTSTLTTLVFHPNGLSNPNSIVVDLSGNIYYTNWAGYIDTWNATTSAVSHLITNIFNPDGVGIDSLGNIYACDTGNKQIKKWSRTDHSTTTIISENLVLPQGIAITLSGTIYYSDYATGTIRKWS